MAGTSQTIETYARLKLDLLNGAHPPGSKLRIDLLCKALDVSPGAVREALSRLTAEGFVRSEPQRGFLVAPVSAEELIDLTAVRIDIELRCLRRAIQVGDVAWESRIVAGCHQLSRTPFIVPSGRKPTFNQAWGELHIRFHEDLVSACDSRWWLHLRQQLSLQAERYRSMLPPHSAAQCNVQAEHEAIVKASIDRDVERATRPLGEHLQKTADILLASGAFPDTKRSTKTIQSSQARLKSRR